MKIQATPFLECHIAGRQQINQEKEAILSLDCVEEVAYPTECGQLPE